MLRALLVVALCVTAIPAQQNAPVIDPSAYQDLRYRLIGPFRASRTVAGVGIPTQPSVFFVGVHTGGVWKTDDYGRTWPPVFDGAPTKSIGDIGVSWSNPGILYVGTGEGLHRPDLGVLYGSITAVPADRETIVGLQEKFLYMLTLFQAADAKPTPQALAAVAELQASLAAMKVRRNSLR